MRYVRTTTDRVIRPRKPAAQQNPVVGTGLNTIQNNSQIGGCVDSRYDSGEILDTVECFDPTCGSWRSAASLNGKPSTGCTAFVYRPLSQTTTVLLYSQEERVRCGYDKKFDIRRGRWVSTRKNPYTFDYLFEQSTTSKSKSSSPQDTMERRI